MARDTRVNTTQPVTQNTREAYDDGTPFIILLHDFSSEKEIPNYYFGKKRSENRMCGVRQFNCLLLWLFSIVLAATHSHTQNIRFYYIATCRLGKTVSLLEVLIYTGKIQFIGKTKTKTKEITISPSSSLMETEGEREWEWVCVYMFLCVQVYIQGVQMCIEKKNLRYQIEFRLKKK